MKRFFLVFVAILFSVSAFAQNLIHIVKAGESIESIANLYGISTNELKQLNPQLEFYPVAVGNSLRLPDNCKVQKDIANSAPQSSTSSNDQRVVLGIACRYIDHEFINKYRDIIEIKELGGVYVTNVLENGSAARAGIRKGDIISEVNGMQITSASTLTEQVSKRRPNDIIFLGVKRGNRVEYVSVTLLCKADIDRLNGAQGTTAATTTTYPTTYPTTYTAPATKSNNKSNKGSKSATTPQVITIYEAPATEPTAQSQSAVNTTTPQVITIYEAPAEPEKKSKKDKSKSKKEEKETTTPQAITIYEAPATEPATTTSTSPSYTPITNTAASPTSTSTTTSSAETTRTRNYSGIKLRMSLGMPSEKESRGNSLGNNFDLDWKIISYNQIVGPLYTGLGLGVNSLSTLYTHNDRDTQYSYSSDRVSLDFPIEFGLRLPWESAVQIDLFTGPEFMCTVGGKDETSYNGEKSERRYNDILSDAKKAGQDVSRWSFLWTVGASLNIYGVDLGFQYRINMKDRDIIKSSTDRIAFYIGYSKWF